MSHPAQLPDLFIDRSLGRIQVPNLLRAAGLRLTTLAEHYGVPRDEDVDDATWLTDVGALGWAVFMKDAAIRRRDVERRALVAARVRAFCLTRQDLGAPAMAQRLVANLPAITRACGDAGPFLYAVHATRIERLDLDP